jgi:hypothetical protein
MPVHGGKHVANRIPGAQLVPLDGDAHFPMGRRLALTEDVTRDYRFPPAHGLKDPVSRAK